MYLNYLSKVRIASGVFSISCCHARNDFSRIGSLLLQSNDKIQRYQTRNGRMTYLAYLILKYATKALHCATEQNDLPWTTFFV